VLPPFECGTRANGPELVVGGLVLPSSSSLVGAGGCALLLAISSFLLWWTSSSRKSNASWLFTPTRHGTKGNNKTNRWGKDGWSRKSKKKKKNALERPKKRKIVYDPDVSASQRRAMLNDTDDDDDVNDAVGGDVHVDGNDDYYRSDDDDDENDNDHTVVTATNPRTSVSDHDVNPSKHHHQASGISSISDEGAFHTNSMDHPISTTNDDDWEEVVRVGGKRSKLRRRLKSLPPSS
jgi:hypothetical protein